MTETRTIGHCYTACVNWWPEEAGTSDQRAVTAEALRVHSGLCKRASPPHFFRALIVRTASQRTTINSVIEDDANHQTRVCLLIILHNFAKR